jgi:PAS domain S-box-containing protein
MAVLPISEDRSESLSGKCVVSDVDAHLPVSTVVASFDHFVQFYESDATLINSVFDYVAAGLEAEETCVIIATGAHREELEHKLVESGFDFVAARESGSYLALDAAETLATFMVDGSPDAERFRASIGHTMAEAAKIGDPVRAFGEMVAILYAEGNPTAAVQLEALWNDLAKEFAFCLFCAYPIDSFAGHCHGSHFADVCDHHSAVMPTESYFALKDSGEKTREIAILQQKARALEAEVAHRREVEKELVRRERELADFFDNAAEGLHKVAADGRILWANRAEVELLGYEREEYVGRSISDFHVDQDVIHDILAKLRAGEEIYNYPACLRAKDGSTRHVLIHSNGYYEDGELVYTRCFTRDVTDRRLMEETLERHLAEIEALNERLRCSVTETHHRVKNNLQVMSAMIEMLALEHKAVNAVPLDDFSRIQSHVRTLAVVHDLLTSRTKEVEEAQIICAKEVLDRLLPMLQDTAWNKTVHFSVKEIDLPSKQCVALALVINELVSNALKHGNSEAQVTVSASDGSAVLEVSDDGPGFPDEFDPVRSANTGLELIENLVRTDLRGKVAYKNREGCGALIRVVFPLPSEEH